jgi:hypothetical protein
VIVSTAITVNYKTPSTSPIRIELKLGKGTLTRVTFDVPPGSNGEVYLRVLHLENSIIPDVVDQWIPVSGGLYEFTPNYNEWKGVYKIQLEGCSPQARYNHTIEVTLHLDEIGTVAQLMQGLIRMGSNG